MAFQLVRAGAKNFKDVVIVPSKADCSDLLDMLNNKGAKLQTLKTVATLQSVLLPQAAITTPPFTPTLPKANNRTNPHPHKI